MGESSVSGAVACFFFAFYSRRRSERIYSRGNGKPRKGRLPVRHVKNELMRRKRIRRVTRVATWEFHYTENGIEVPAGELTCKKPAQTKLAKSLRLKFHTNP